MKSKNEKRLQCFNEGPFMVRKQRGEPEREGALLMRTIEYTRQGKEGG